MYRIPDVTEVEIELCKAEIQAGWDAATRRRRATGNSAYRPYELPVVAESCFIRTNPRERMA